MSNWPMVRLGDAATFINGMPFKPTDWGTKGLPIIRIQNLTGSSSEINYYSGSFPIKYEVNNGDILISWSASLGVYIWDKGKAVLNQHIFKVIFDKLNFDKRYFKYVLSSKINEMIKYTHGSTMKHITKRYFDAVQIPYPPFETQREIADVLDKAKNLIDLRKKQIEKMDLLVKSKFIEMFGDPVTNPKGWEVVYLKAACVKLTDGTHFSPVSLNKGDYKYITAKNIKPNGFDLENITYISKDIHATIYNRCNPEFGDILYIKDGVTTGVAQINTLKEEFSLLSSVALLKHNRDLLVNYYLRDLLNNNKMYKAIRGQMGGAAITRLTITKLNGLQIPIPPFQLQKKYALVVESVDKQKTVLQQGLYKMEMNYKSLIQEYFG